MLKNKPLYLLSQMKVYRYILLLLFCVQNLVNAQPIWNLERCILYAQENNLQVKIAQLNAELNDATYTQSKFSFLPSVNANGNYGTNRGRNIDPTTNTFIEQDIVGGSGAIGSSLDLFGGFRKINQMRQSYYSYMSSKYAADQTLNDVSLNVANAYLQIIFAREQQLRAEQALTLSKEQLDRTRKLVEVGLQPEVANYTMEAQVAQDEVNLITATNQYNVSLLNLQLLLNLDKPVLIEVPAFELPDRFGYGDRAADSIYNKAVVDFPGVMSSYYNMQSSFKGLQTARGARYPSLNLNYNVFTNYSDAARTITGFDTTGNILPVGYVMMTNELVVAPELRYNFQSIPFSEQLNSNLGQNIGIGLSIPIFNGWSANSNVKRSRLQWTIAKYNYDQSRLNLKRDISTAVTDAQNASKRYNAQKKLTESLQTTLDYTTKRYEAGLLNVYDFNTARKNLFDAQSQALQAKYDYLFKLKILDFYQGKKITLP